MKTLVTTSCAILIATAAGAHESKTLDELLATWGSDPADATVTIETLKPGLHALFAAGGTAIVSIGDQGVLMVDDQFPQVLPKLKKSIRDLGGDNIDFVINTHWHFDHADNNPKLGAEGAWIVAHSNSRLKMIDTATILYDGYSYDQPAYPREGLPVFTFNDRMQIHFNGQKIELMHFGPAHTTGDAIVFFRRDNVVHVGDLYSSGYPYIDAANGGSLAGLIAACRLIVAAIDEDTIIVSGHSAVAGYDDLAAYLLFLEQSHDRLEALIEAGLTVRDILDDTLESGLDLSRGDPTLFIKMAYMGFAH